MCTFMTTHTCTCSMCIVNYFLPLMIVVIACGGKCNFHKVSFFLLSPFSFLTSVSSLSLLPLVSFCSPLFLLPPLFLFILQLLLSTSPSTYLLSVVGSSLSFTPSFAPSTFFLLRGLFSSLCLSIYLYQWAKVILSSSSRWADSACGKGEEKRGAEEQSFSYSMNSTVSSSGNTMLYKPSLVKGEHSTWFWWLVIPKL